MASGDNPRDELEALNPFTLMFEDKAVEAEYRCSHLDLMRSPKRMFVIPAYTMIAAMVVIRNNITPIVVRNAPAPSRQLHSA
jgi:hypothetical protein